MQTKELIEKLKAATLLSSQHNFVSIGKEMAEAIIAALQTKEIEEKSDEEWFYQNNEWQDDGLATIDKKTFLSFCQHIRSTELAAAKKEIEEKEKRIDELITRNTLAYKSGYDAAKSDCKQQIEELKAWKKEAIAVMPDFQAIGRLIGVPLGQSIHDKILPALIELKRKNDELRKITALYPKGYLETRIESLQKENEELKQENNLLRQTAEAQIKSNQSLSRIPDKELIDEVKEFLAYICHSYKLLNNEFNYPALMYELSTRAAKLLTKYNNQSK